MFKKLKDKITEDLKSSPQRFQQLTQSVTDKLQNSTTNDENFFSIGEDDANTSTASTDAGFSSVSLMSPSESRYRRNSNSSIASDISFLPRYESSAMYQLQSDLDVSASEVEDNASSTSQLGHLTKEQLYSAFQKAQMRYHKYRGRYTDLAKHYKELERENGKMKSVLVETQDKAIRRVKELKEQCSLEQKAKAHLESVLRDELDEKQFKIQTLETKINLLSTGAHPEPLVQIESNSAESSENLEVLTKYLNDARQEIETLNSKLQELKAASIVFQSKEQEYKKKIAALEKDTAQISEREKENNLKFAQNKMELHNEILSKDAEILNMKKDLETLRQSLESYETQNHNTKLENLQTQNAKLIERVETLTQKSNNLESELLKVEQYKLEIKNLTETVAELRIKADNTDMQNLLSQKEDQIKDLSNRLESATDINEKLTKEMNNLKTGLQTFKDQISSLSQEKQLLTETIHREKTDYEKQIEDIRENARKGLLSLEAKIKEKIGKEYENKEEILKQEFTMKLNEFSTNGTNLKDVQLKLMEKEKLIENLYEDINIAQNEKQTKDNMYRDLEKNHLELIEDATHLRNTITTLEKDLSNIKNESQDYTEKIARLQANVTTLRGDIEESRNLQKQKDYECIALNSEKVHLEEQLRLVQEKKELDALEATESKLLELKLQKLEEKHVRVSKELEGELQKNCDLGMQLRENQTILDDYKRLTDRVAELENELSNVSESKKDLKEQLDTVQNSVDGYKKSAAEKNMLESLIKNLEEEKQKIIDSFEVERKSFQECFDRNIKNEEKLEKLLEDNIKTSEHINNNKEAMNKLNQDVKSLTEQCESYKKTIEDKNKSLETLREALDKEIKEKDSQVDSMNRKIEELSTTIKKQTEDFSGLLDRSNQLDVMIEKMQADSENSIRKEKNVQAELLQKLESCQSDVLVKIEEIALLQTKLNELEKSYSIDKENMDRLNNKNNDLQNRIATLEAMEDSFKIIGQEKEVVEEELTRLKVIENNYNRLNDEVEQLRKKLKESEDFKEQVNRKINKLTEDLANANNNYEQILQEKESLLKEINRLKGNIEDLVIEKNELQESLTLDETEQNLVKSTLENGLDKAQQEIAELNLRINQLYSDNNHVNDENQELVARVEELKVKNEFLESEKLQTETVKSNLEGTSKKLNEEIEELTQQLNRVQKQNLELLNSKPMTNETELLKIQQDCYEIKEKCDNLFIENKNLKLEITTLEEKCNNFTAIKKNYETQMEELEHQYNELVHERQLLQDEVQELKISPLNLQNNSGGDQRLDNLEILRQEKAFQTDASNNNDKYIKEIDSLRDKLTQYKSLDITNKSSIEFYENELQKMKNKNEKLTRKLDETLVTLNHCAELNNSTEIEYLKNVLYNYMLGKESLVLARVIAAVCKFDPQQTETVIQKEQQKQTLLGHLGIL